MDVKLKLPKPDYGYNENLGYDHIVFHAEAYSINLTNQIAKSAYKLGFDTATKEINSKQEVKNIDKTNIFKELNKEATIFALTKVNEPNVVLEDIKNQKIIELVVQRCAKICENSNYEFGVIFSKMLLNDFASEVQVNNKNEDNPIVDLASKMKSKL